MPEPFEVEKQYNGLKLVQWVYNQPGQERNGNPG